MLKAKYGSYMRPVFFGDEETAAGFSSEFAKKTLLNISFAAEKASDTIQYNVNIESFTVADVAFSPELSVRLVVLY